MTPSQQIYDTITRMIPDLQRFEPFTKMNLGSKGLADIHVVVFDVANDALQFVISQHVREQGRLVANPCFEIAIDFEKKTAHAVSYMNGYRFFDAKSTQSRISAAIQSEADGALLQWLNSLQRA